MPVGALGGSILQGQPPGFGGEAGAKGREPLGGNTGLLEVGSDPRFHGRDQPRV